MRLRCRFARRNCPHDAHDAQRELFTSAYQRVNRARGTKILRCFPHCGATHIPRSYCGATLELRIDAVPTDGTSCTNAVVSPDQLVVFARFRERDAAPVLRVGDRVALAAITDGVQSPANTKAPWIQSRLVRSSSHSRESLVFEINPGRRWYYSWHSSKNSSTRATKHVLEAFVFLQSAGDGDTVRCVATVTSPSFTLVSFRRVTASETALIAGELKDHAQAPASSTTLRPSLRVLFKQEPSMVSSRPQQLPSPRVDEANDPLAVLFRVAQQLPLGDATDLIPHWMALTEGATGVRRRVRERETVGRLCTDGQTAAHVVWWLSVDEATKTAWRDHTQRGARVLLNRVALHACYDRWHRWLTSHVECVLVTLEMPPLRELAASLTTSVVGHGDRNRNAYVFGWQGFVAQARELFTGVAYPTLATKRVDTRRYWSCPLERVSIASLSDGAPWHKSSPHASVKQLPVTALFAFWQQLRRVHMELNTSCSPPTLTIASSLDDHEAALSPVMTLLLDNRLRCCPVLPNGEATLAAAGLSGDYIATQRRDGTIEITMFTWPSAGSHSAWRWQWTLRRDALASRRLDVDLLVSAAVLRPITTEGGGDMATWSIHDKLAGVAVWRDAYKVRLAYAREEEVATASW